MWGREDGCTGYCGWVQLPLSFAAMQCSYWKHLPFRPQTWCDCSLQLFVISQCAIDFSVNRLRKPPQKPLVFWFFSVFIYLFHIAYSQQFIHSTVIIVLALQTRRVRQCSSPVSGSCIKVQQAKIQVFLTHISVNIIDICICLNIHFYMWYLSQSLAWHCFDISTLEGLCRDSRSLRSPSAGFGFNALDIYLRAVVTFR